MLPKGVLSKIGGVISLISLLFLPLVKGCGQSITGFDVLKAGDVPGGIKFFLVATILCAIAVFFLKTAPAFFFSGGGGLAGFFGAYTIARQKFPVELAMGAYLAIIGFAAILAEGFLEKQNMSGAGFRGGGTASKFCSQCGSKNEAGAGFCKECGAKL